MNKNSAFIPVTHKCVMGAQSVNFGWGGLEMGHESDFGSNGGSKLIEFDLIILSLIKIN